MGLHISAQNRVLVEELCLFTQLPLLRCDSVLRYEAKDVRNFCAKRIWAKKSAWHLPSSCYLFRDKWIWRKINAQTSF